MQDFRVVRVLPVTNPVFGAWCPVPGWYCAVSGARLIRRGGRFSGVSWAVSSGPARTLHRTSRGERWTRHP